MAHEQAKTNSAQVLTTATLRAADILGVESADLDGIIGLDAATMRGGDDFIHPDTPEGQRAVLFLRAFQSLGGMLGSDETMRKWVHGYNAELQAVPMKLMKLPSGLTEICEYLDAYRESV